MATAVETTFTTEDNTIVPVYQLGYQPVWFFMGYRDIDAENQDEIGEWIDNVYVDEQTLQEYGSEHAEYITYNFNELYSTCDELWNNIITEYGKVAELKERYDRATASLEAAETTQEAEDLMFVMNDLEEEIAREMKSCAEVLTETYGDNFLNDARRRFGESFNAYYGLQQCAYLKQKTTYETWSTKMHEEKLAKARRTFGKKFDPKHVRKPSGQEVLDKMPREVRGLINKHKDICERARTRMDYRRFQRTIVADLQMYIDENFEDAGIRTELIEGIGRAKTE